MRGFSETGDLTVGSTGRVLLRFAVPVFFSLLFQQLYSAADSLIVGNTLGKEALAAVGSSNSLIGLLTGLVNGVAMGGSVVIARYFGAGNLEKVRRAIHTGVLAGFLAGAFISVFGVLLSPAILRLMGTAPEVLPESIAYFRWYFAGGLSIMMYNVFRSIMAALGDSRTPLVYLIVSSVLNVVLDLFFIRRLGGGVGSAAVATTLAQTVAVGLCLKHFLSGGSVCRLHWKELRIDPETLKEILRCGIPSGVQDSVISFANVLVQSNINSFGAVAMAACGAYNKLQGFVFLPISSFAMALSTFVGQNLGARQYERAKRGARFGITVSCVGAELIGVLTILFAAPLMGLFTDSEEVIAIGVEQIRIESMFYMFLAYAHCVAGVCRGAGKANVPMVIMLSVWCAFRILYITAAMHICHDIRLLFWAYPITWSISDVIFARYYRRSDWLHGFEKAEATA